jgi:hypothetical protein
MGTLKSFLLGVGVSFVVYYITRKGPEGISILDEILNDPSAIVDKAKKYAIIEGTEALRKIIS